MNLRIALVIAIPAVLFIVGTIIAVIRDIKYIDASIKRQS